MDPRDDDEAPEARPPLLADLVNLCRDLNAVGAAYVVIGGMAVIQGNAGWHLPNQWESLNRDCTSGALQRRRPLSSPRESCPKGAIRRRQRMP
jgi:hypothetical protein